MKTFYVCLQYEPGRHLSRKVYDSVDSPHKNRKRTLVSHGITYHTSATVYVIESTSIILRSKGYRLFY